jgi:DNA-binding winged helix-turn-helix (wHTH) protein
MAEFLCFGSFKFVPPENALYKGATRIRLQEHPATVLRVLLERAGEVVSREEIRARVWPNGTLVEFDHGINTAVNRLRTALGDRADKPRYIETVARKGYRFVAAIQRSDKPSSEIRSRAAVDCSSRSSREQRFLTIGSSSKSAAGPSEMYTKRSI